MHVKQLGRISFHAAACLIFLCGLIKFAFVGALPHKKPHETFAGRWKYLTYWDMWIQFLYFAFCLYIDLRSASSDNYFRLIRLRDKMFSSLAVPYGLFVFSVFWILYSVNREYIFPRVLDAIIPPWLNHISHTAMIPILLVEAWLVKHRHPRTRDGLAITILLGAIYISWVLFLALVMDIWVYPILAILNWGMRIAFFSVCLAFLVISYFIGEKVNGLLWGEKLKEEKRKK